MPNIKLLLNESVKNVGKVGDIVEVSPGYARNYLVPKGLAVKPTAGNVKKIEARRLEIERLEQEKRSHQAAIIAKLAGVEVTLERKANEQGHLFGSVSATDISKALKAQGYEVNPDDVLLPGKLDRIDTYTVRIKFVEDLATDLKVWVAPDSESKALIDSAAKAKAAEPPPPSNFENVKK
ncbi:MAG: 50S ribosomal protein L9 [Tepidisphaeraceae bacterium]|jgi:large subunit ribosomal protein L9